MPPPKTYKKKKYFPKKKSYGKKKYYRKKKSYGPRSTQLKGPMKLFGAFAPFPPTYSCKMHYVESISCATGVAGVFGTNTTFNLNSLYQVKSVGGHQPYGFDQMAALYKRYLISGVLIELHWNNPSADGVVAGAMVQASGGVGSMAGITPDIIKEQPLSWIKPVNNTGSQTAKFKQYFPLFKIEGLQKVQWIANQDQYGALVSASPSLMPTVKIAAASDSGSGADNITCRVELTFYTRFYDRILQAYS